MVSVCFDRRLSVDSVSLSQSVGNYVYGYLVKQFLKHVVLRCYPSVHNQSVPVLPILLSMELQLVLLDITCIADLKPVWVNRVFLVTFCLSQPGHTQVTNLVLTALLECFNLLVCFFESAELLTIFL